MTGVQTCALPICNLASELGRTPSASDIRRYGLPSLHAYRNRFGSYSDACKSAGLVSNQPSPGSESPYDQIAILNAYATSGSALRAGHALGISESAVLNCLHRYGFPFPPYYRGVGRREWAADMAQRLAGEANTKVA